MKASNTIMVVAGGPSVAKLSKAYRDNLINEATVIGVNDSALYMPVDYAVTMDRLWLENRYEKMKELGITTYYRICTAKNVKPQQPQFIPYHGNVWRGQMTLEPGQLWGDNSGKVALNLAYQMAPKRVFMLGFDMQVGVYGNAGMTGAVHWYPDYPWGGGPKPSKMEGWAMTFDYMEHQFVSAGIELRNVVAVDQPSLIAPDRVPRMKLNEFEKDAWKGKLARPRPK